MDENFFDQCTVLKVGKDGKILTKEHGWLKIDWAYINRLPPEQKQRVLASVGRMLEKRKQSLESQTETIK